MNKLFFKKTICLIIVILTSLLLVACSSQAKTGEQTDNSQLTPPANSQQQQSSGSDPGADPGSNSGTIPNSGTSPAQITEKERTLLQQVRQLAEQGKIINCEFAAKTTVYDEVEKKWGNAESMDWVAAAKGNYATYPDRGVVLGINKGSQVFEVRSYARQIQNLSLSAVKEFFGVPPYEVKINGEQIIGYTAGPEFKIEFVFPEPTSNNPDPLLDHYLVLYPQGTVNYMANDPGRQW